MPGIIVFRRRWVVGSDDLIVPAGFLVIFHTIWLAILVITLLSLQNSLLFETICQKEFLHILIGFLVTWICAILVEIAIIFVSWKGTILEDELRWHSEYLLYIKLVVWICEIGYTIFSAIWLKNYYNTCENISTYHQNLILGLVIGNGILFVSAVMTIWCSFDIAGRSWVKLKKYQKSLREQNTKKFGRPKFYRRSGANSNRSWRHRKVRRAYQSRWDSRCQLLLCCVKPGSCKGRNSFADIARVLSEFFRDLDVVPSDVIVGLVLLRKRQQLLRIRTIHQANNPVYQFLSGVRVTPRTHFLDPTNQCEAGILQDIYHFMHFALAMYGWPIYLRKNTVTAICQLCTSLNCICCQSCLSNGKPSESVVIDDNCCGCNYAVFTKMCHLPDTYLVYMTYHVDVAETPFMVVLDYTQKAIVISIRGTLSLEDIITDLNAEGEPIPVRPINEDWLGHKGMADAALYIYKKLKEDHLLTKAFNWDPERHTQDFEIVCVGHSLGAGTATILAIMLKQEFPNTKCYAFSPPGGLISQEAVEYTKSFVTSVVLGKDVVPRIGLHQLESLRHDLIYAIHKSTDPKWKTLMGSVLCCMAGMKEDAEWTEAEVEAQLSPTKKPRAPSMDGNNSPEINIHPWDSTVNLSVHQPLYPPGRILHIVRHYPKTQIIDRSGHKIFKRGVDPVFKAIWADHRSFDEVLISKRMVQDHMPDNVLRALEKLLKQDPKATRQLGDENVPRIVIQEATSTTNETLDKMSTQLDKVEVVEVTHEEGKVFSNPMQNDEFPLFDEEVAPIASPDETCIDICNSSVSDAQDERRSYPPPPAFDPTYHSYSEN